MVCRKLTVGGGECVEMCPIMVSVECLTVSLLQPQQSLGNVWTISFKRAFFKAQKKRACVEALDQRVSKI